MHFKSPPLIHFQNRISLTCMVDVDLTNSRDYLLLAIVFKSVSIS